MVLTWEVNSRSSSGSIDTGISPADWARMSQREQDQATADLLADVIGYGVNPPE